jgi:hypothetical protein
MWHVAQRAFDSAQVANVAICFAADFGFGERTT